MSSRKAGAEKKEAAPAVAPVRKVTIKDLAEACGVATSTVSNALTGRRFVVEETRQLILHKAEKIGYRASSLARGLRLHRSWTIGILVGDITNPFFSELIRGAEGVVASENYNLTLCDTDYRVEKQEAYLRLLRDKQVDGLIIASQAAMVQGLAELTQSGFPLVFINQRYPKVQTDYVGVDNTKGLDDACRHLWSLGHRRIAFVRGREGSTAAQDRFNCFKAAIVGLAGRLDEGLVDRGDYTYESGIVAARRLLSLPTPPTAIVTANDLTALGVIEAAESLGLKIPADVSVIGMDDIFVSGLPRVSLTTVRQPKWELGVAAARMILRRIEDGPGGLKETILESQLVKRSTSGPAPHLG